MKGTFLYSILLFLGLSCKPDREPKVVVVNKAVFRSEIMGKDVQLVDVRTTKEYELGHIEDAINFDVKDSLAFLKQISTLDKEEPVYLYCKKGGRSNRAVQILKEKGFHTIFDYSGGYDDWISN
nr:rhodanese-like domain-containing protein [Allomuricauda sp.]